MSSPGPWASLRPARDAARAAHRTGHAVSTGNTAVGSSATDLPWRLDTNEHGDLVAIHTNGTIRRLATLEED